MNKYLTALLLLTLFSCQDKYDGEKRILLDLTVKDRQGNLLSGKHIEIFADDGIDYYLGGHTDLITYGESDENGKVKLVFPVRQNYASVYTLHVESDADFTDTEITQIDEEECTNYKVPVSEFTLLRPEEIVSLNIQPTPVTNMELVGITIEGLLSGSVSYGLPDPGSNLYYQTNFQVAKNSQIRIKYTTRLNGVLTNQEQIVEIGGENQVYILNY